MWRRTKALLVTVAAGVCYGFVHHVEDLFVDKIDTAGNQVGDEGLWLFDKVKDAVLPLVCERCGCRAVY